MSESTTDTVTERTISELVVPPTAPTTSTEPAAPPTAPSASTESVAHNRTAAFDVLAPFSIEPEVQMPRHDPGDLPQYMAEGPDPEPNVEVEPEPAPVDRAQLLAEAMKRQLATPYQPRIAGGPGNS